MRCDECAFYRSVSEKPPAGTCRNAPPVVMLVPTVPSPSAPGGGIAARSFWPAVPADSFCREFKSKVTQ